MKFKVGDWVEITEQAKKTLGYAQRKDVGPYCITEAILVPDHCSGLSDKAWMLPGFMANSNNNHGLYFNETFLQLIAEEVVE